MEYCLTTMVLLFSFSEHVESPPGRPLSQPGRRLARPLAFTKLYDARLLAARLGVVPRLSVAQWWRFEKFLRGKAVFDQQHSTRCRNKQQPKTKFCMKNGKIWPGGIAFSLQVMLFTSGVAIANFWHLLSTLTLLMNSISWRVKPWRRWLSLQTIIWYFWVSI